MENRCCLILVIYIKEDPYKRQIADIMTEVYGKCCYILLTRVTTYEFLDILNYKSYHKKNATIRYVDVVKAMRNGKAIVRTTIGFAPLLLRYLREKDIQHEIDELIIDKKYKEIDEKFSELCKRDRYRKTEKGYIQYL